MRRGIFLPAKDVHVDIPYCIGAVNFKVEIIVCFEEPGGVFLNQETVVSIIPQNVFPV